MRRLLKTFGLLAVTALFLGPVAAAQADPFALEIDNAVMDLGGLEGVRGIDSTIVPPDPSATLTGEVTGSDVTIPKAGFVFPTKEAEVSPGLNAVIDMEANEDIAGTYDSGTGDVELAMSLKATVAVLGSDCVISPISLVLSTKNGKPYLGEPFSGGLSGDGALSGRWAGLPPVTGGGMCGTVAGLIAGPGGIWMSHGITDPQTCADQPSHPGCDVAAQAPGEVPRFTGGPGSDTEATEATFTFEKGATEASPVTGFQCSLDSGPFEACDTGTMTYSGLAVGSHKIEVKATNTVGEGPTASYPWTITKPIEVCPPGTTGTPPNCVKINTGSKHFRPKIRSATKHRVTLKKRARTIRAAKVTCGKAPCRIKRVKARYIIRGKVYHAGKARFPKGRFRAGKARFVKVTMPGKIFRKAPRGKKIGFVKVRVVAVSKNGVRATRNIAIGIGKR